MSTAKGPALNPSTGRFRKRHIGLIVYFVFLLLPIYWLIAMSVRPNQEILSGFDLFPRTITFANYVTIFTDPSWYTGYLNSIQYVALNTVISLSLVLPLRSPLHSSLSEPRISSGAITPSRIGSSSSPLSFSAS